MRAFFILFFGDQLFFFVVLLFFFAVLSFFFGAAFFVVVFLAAGLALDVLELLFFAVVFLGLLALAETTSLLGDFFGLLFPYDPAARFPFLVLISPFPIIDSSV